MGNQSAIPEIRGRTHFLNYAYDDASQVTGITYRKADTTVIGDLTYTYDNAGRRIKTSGSLATIDLPNSVTDAIYNANNQLTQWAGNTFTYDANGNLTGDGSLTYTWDARDQLASLSGGATASFAYDGLGRRIGKTIGSTTTGYVYDGGNFVQEKDGTGGTAAVVANLITGLSLDETYARMTGTGGSAVLSHFLPDANNNVIRLLDGAQAVTDSYSYEAYGKTTQTGSNLNSQQYTGRENDGTGLYYYRARYYSPAAGRFISEDPIGLNAGPNVYAYVGGNPLGYTDPAGLCPWCAAGAAIGVWANIGFQLAQNGGNWGQLDPGQVILAGLAGAASGGLGTITAGLRMGWNIAANAVGSATISAAQKTASNAMNGQCLSNNVGTSAALGGLFGGIGAAGGAGFNAWRNASNANNFLNTSNAVSGPFFPSLSKNWAPGGTVTGNVISNTISNANQ